MSPSVPAPLQLVLTALPNIPLIQPGADLAAMILDSLAEISLAQQSGDVLVIAQKIVSKSEGRYVDLREVVPSPRAHELAVATEKDPRLVELILAESTEVVRYRAGVLVVAHRLGYVSANAGIDASNVDQHGDSQRVLLLPSDPDRTAADIRTRLMGASGAEVGVIINDTHGRAFRSGTVGVAIGAAGVPALLDLRGQPDLFDRTLRVSQVGLADELAAAASVLMGQADEGRPIIHIRGVPYPLRKGDARELIRAKEQDLFR